MQKCNFKSSSLAHVPNPDAVNQSTLKLIQFTHHHRAELFLPHTRENWHFFLHPFKKNSIETVQMDRSSTHLNTKYDSVVLLNFLQQRHCTREKKVQKNLIFFVIVIKLSLISSFNSIYLYFVFDVNGSKKSFFSSSFCMWGLMKIVRVFWIFLFSSFIRLLISFFDL